MSYYKEKGYPTIAVIESLMTIINSITKNGMPLIQTKIS